MDYLFNVFLISAHGVGRTALIVLLLLAVVYPTLRYVTSPGNAFDRHYRAIQRLTLVVGAIVIAFVLVLSASSSMITPKHTTYSPEAEAKRIDALNDEASETAAGEAVTTDRVRGYMPEDHKSKLEYRDMVDYTDPMFEGDGDAKTEAAAQ